MIRLQYDIKPDFFYSLVPFLPEEMTHEEIVAEMQALQDWFDQCIKLGRVIATKESKRFRDCRMQLIRKTFGENGDVKALENQLAQFFEPIEDQN